MSDKIRLIVRGDDFGMCHAINEGFVKCFKEGFLTSASLMVPPPWFTEAVEICKENPDFQIGIHLDLTSEWYPYRWKPVLPISDVPTLVDKDGFFWRNTKDFLAGEPDLNQVEKELRAQVKLASDKGIDIAYLDTHMGTARATPELRGMVEKIAKEYRVPISGRLGEKRAGSIYTTNPPEKPEKLFSIIGGLEPGLNIMVDHPGLDTPEMRGMNAGYKGTMDVVLNVATHRDWVTKAFTSSKIKSLIRKKGIELVGVRDLRDQWRNEGKL